MVKHDKHNFTKNHYEPIWHIPLEIRTSTTKKGENHRVAPPYPD